MKAAGILFCSGGRVLLLKRAADSSDYPDYWCFPGGTTEDGETAELTAIRESLEETGLAPEGPLAQIAVTELDDVQFTTFASVRTEQDTPTLDFEHSASIWQPLDKLTMPDGAPLHPGVAQVLALPEVLAMRLTQLNDLDVARAMAVGVLPSPQKFHNVTLFAMRITGTGTAYRAAHDEYVYRPPEKYLTSEFLARCNGLPVIFQHPENDSLDSEEFSERVIGTIFYPYLKPELAEVWGIAKCYDDAAISIMGAHEISTSPNVIFRKDTNSTIQLENGNDLLIEGMPCLLDHLAVCALGVWDKGGPPSGIENLQTGVNDMNEAELKAKADAEAETKAKADAAGEDNVSMADVMKCVNGLVSRMDAMEETKAKADAAGEEEKAKEEKAKADAAEETAKADAARGTLTPEIRAEIERLGKQFAPVQVSEADAAELSTAQARADAVAQAFGESAPRPFQGEGPLAYRKRLAAKFKQHSPDYKDLDLNVINDSGHFALIEKTIYNDAQHVANTPILAEGEGLREMVSMDRTGRKISTFIGAPSAWMDQFKLPSRQFAGFKKQGSV